MSSKTKTALEITLEDRDPSLVENDVRESWTGNRWRDLARFLGDLRLYEAADREWHRESSRRYEERERQKSIF